MRARRTFLGPASALVLAFLLVLQAGVVACGGSGAARPDPETPAPGASADATHDPRPGVSSTAAPPLGSASASAPPAASSGLPTTCADPSNALCMPTGDFVERLCARPLQDVTLALFAKESPFTRLYLRGRVDELDFDEEVLALRFHGPSTGGMVVGSGNGTYDALRWDGTCSRGIEAEMISRTRPPRPKNALVKWHRIGAHMQDALVDASDAVKKAHARRGKECQGAMSGDVSKSCEAADRALVDAIVDTVRTHGGLPAPDHLP